MTGRCVLRKRLLTAVASLAALGTALGACSSADPSGEDHGTLSGTLTVAGYGRECAAVSQSFNLDPDSTENPPFGQSAAEITWEEAASALGFARLALEPLEPPRELRGYHEAQIGFLEAYSDVARRRPPDGSFVEDSTKFTLEALPGLVQIGKDDSKSEQERLRQAESFMQDTIRKHFGGEFLSAHTAVKQSLSALPQATRVFLAESGCSMGNP